MYITLAKLFIVFAIISILAASYFISYRHNPLATITVREETRGQVSLTYPFVSGLGKVSNIINSSIEKNLAAFVHMVTLPGQIGQVGYHVEFNRSNILSLTLHQSIYGPQADHVNSNLEALTFDTVSGEALALKQLFLPGVNYQERLNALARQQLADRHVLLPKPFTGVGTEQEFYLTDDALVLCYHPGEYALSSAGLLQIIVPFEYITDILKPELNQ